MKQRKVIAILAMILVLVLSVGVLAACNPKKEEKSVYARISKPEAVMTVGGSVQLKASTTDGAGVEWSTSNAAVATVDSTGLVNAVSAGEAKITAGNGNGSADCVVTVVAAGTKVLKRAKTYVDDGKSYTMSNYVTTTPSTWNELSSTDENNDAIMGYIGSSFYQTDFQFEGGKFNADGTINADGIVSGKFDVQYDAATALKDVTAQYGEAWGLTEAQIAEGGYIWQITLRDDLAWDDGTAIYAEDFVYSMKEQLNPLFKLERADTYYANAVKIHNAKEYYYQGSKGWYQADTPYSSITADLESKLIWKVGPIAKDGEGKDAITGSLRAQYNSGYESAGLNATQSAGDFLTVFGSLVGAPVGVSASAINALEGKTIAEIKADDSLKATYDALIEWWDEGEDGALAFCVTEYTWPTVDFSKVGIFADGDYNVVVVCDNPMTFFKEDGTTLSYLAAYNFQSLPLVKKSLYESCKVAPQEGSSTWTTTYNTSLSTSASWGPYKLASFQDGKQFVLARNEYWYGYADAENNCVLTKEALYQTDRIVTEVIAKEEGRQLAFWKGEIDGLGLSVTIADDYKNSKYVIYSPRVANFGIQVYSNLDVLKKDTEHNNGVLAITEFREALSLSLDRTKYNKELTTANQPCLGFMGEDYYYDVENGGVYRYTDQAKEALLRTYGMSKNDAGKWTDGTKVYETMQEAYESLTGYNMTLAKQKVEEAYTILTSDPGKYGYNANKKIQIVYGESEDNESAQRFLRFFQNWISELVKGTSFENKVEVVSNFTLGNKWADKFKDGTVQLSTGGLGNAPFDPFYMIGGWIGCASSVNYHPYWDVEGEFLTYTLPAGDYVKAGETVTLSVLDWYNSLNGNMSDGATYNWSSAPREVRLEILAMLEEYGLKKYYCIATSRGFTASLSSAKGYYITDEHNVMVGFGGIKYKRYNYTDEAWTAFVSSNGGDLSEFYKTTD